MAQPDAAGRYPVGRTCVGAAVSYRAGALGALLAEAGTQTQTPHRLGASACPSGAALVSAPDHRRSGRRSFRLCTVAFQVDRATTADHLCHTPASGCTPVSACTAA